MSKNRIFSLSRNLGTRVEEGMSQPPMKGEGGPLNRQSIIRERIPIFTHHRQIRFSSHILSLPPSLSSTNLIKIPFFQQTKQIIPYYIYILCIHISIHAYIL